MELGRRGELGRGSAGGLLSKRHSRESMGDDDP